MWSSRRASRPWLFVIMAISHKVRLLLGARAIRFGRSQVDSRLSNLPFDCDNNSQSSKSTEATNSKRLYLPEVWFVRSGTICQINDWLSFFTLLM
jgi:hypothetical protein